MNLNAIPIFIQVVKSHSFSKAADQLGMTKSKVSKAITQLEAELGTKLLFRTTRKINLTEAGKRYYEQAEQGLHFIENAAFSATELRHQPKGQLKISAPMSFGQLHIAPLIPGFLKRYPEVSIDLVLSDEKLDLIENGFDLAIRAGKLPDSSLVARKLSPLKSALCASPAYLKTHGHPRTPADLKRHNCLLYSYSQPVDEWGFKKGSRESVVRVSGNYRVNNSEALRESLLKGIGIGRLPTFVAGPEIKKGRLIHLLDDYQMRQISLFALFPERQFLPQKVRCFIDFMIDKLGGETPYWDESLDV